MGRKDKQVPLESIAALQLGARMRRARQAKGISLTSLAQQLSYTKSHLSAVENGIGRPSQTLVEQYEQVLGFEAGTLMRQLHDMLLSSNNNRHLYSPGVPPDGAGELLRSMQNNGLSASVSASPTLIAHMDLGKRLMFPNFMVGRMN